MPVAAESLLQAFEDALMLLARLEQVNRKRDRGRRVTHGFLPVLVCAAKQVGLRVVATGYMTRS